MLPDDEVSIEEGMEFLSRLYADKARMDYMQSKLHRDREGYETRYLYLNERIASLLLPTNIASKTWHPTMRAAIDEAMALAKVPK